MGAELSAAIVMLVVLARTATGSSASAATPLRRRRMRRIADDSLSFLPTELAVGLANGALLGALATGGAPPDSPLPP